MDCFFSFCPKWNLIKEKDNDLENKSLTVVNVEEITNSIEKIIEPKIDNLVDNESEKVIDNTINNELNHIPNIVGTIDIVLENNIIS